MIKIDRFTLTSDKYQWILTENIPSYVSTKGRHKGRVVNPTRTTFYGKFDQAARVILERLTKDVEQSSDVDKVSTLVTLYTEGVKALSASIEPYVEAR